MDASRTYPLISCICVTHGKPALLNKAINCFTAQTYPNKELVLLYEEEDIETAEYIRGLEKSTQIKVICVDRKEKCRLGELRNIAIRAADGEFICQWDDDDWYHSGRLAYNYKAAVGSGYAGCIMNQWLVFDALTRNAYVSNKRPWEGSIFCRRAYLVKEKYDNISIGEDTSVITSLLSQKLLYAIKKMPHLYIYVYHGSNTWNHEHWKLIFRCSKALPPDISATIAKIISEDYSATEGSLLLGTILNNHIIPEYD